jgi:nucleoid-associated protein YgaU
VKPYTIRHGDTLAGIAKQQLGSAHLWPLLWQHNHTVLQRDQKLIARVMRAMKGPDWIFPGTVIDLEIGIEQAVNTPAVSTPVVGPSDDPTHRMASDVR